MHVRRQQWHIMPTQYDEVIGLLLMDHSAQSIDKVKAYTLPAWSRQPGDQWNREDKLFFGSGGTVRGGFMEFGVKHGGGNGEIDV